MKLQCDLCREIVTAELAIDAAGGAVEVHCPACDGRFTVAARPAAAPAPASAAAATPAAAPTPAAAAAPARPAPAPGAPSMTCPKCGDVQPPADACRACGLRADRMDAFQAAAGDAPPEVAAAWAACEEAWPDAARHDRFAHAVAAAGCYAWAARRYRDVLRRDPADPVAAARLARITSMTEATLRAAAAPPRPGQPGAAPAAKPYRSTIAVLVGLLVLVGVGLVWAVVARSSAPPDAPPIPVKPAPHLHAPRR